MQLIDPKYFGLVSGGEQECMSAGGDYMDVGFEPIAVDTSSISQLPEVNQEVPTVNVTGTLSNLANGFQTAGNDCSSGAALGATIGFAFEGIGAGPGAALGCLWGVGAGIIRDLGKP